MTLDGRRSTGSRRLGGDATPAGSGIKFGADVSRATLGAASNAALSTELCCGVCFEAACGFD